MASVRKMACRSQQMIEATSSSPGATKLRGAHHDNEEIENAAAIEERHAKGWHDADAATSIAIAAISSHQRWC